VQGRPRLNWFHVASFLSHWPTAIALLYLSGLSWPWWIVASLFADLAWWAGKRIGGKNWSFWWRA
jgi:hypothetical protein